MSTGGELDDPTVRGIPMPSSMPPPQRPADTLSDGSSLGSTDRGAPSTGQSSLTTTLALREEQSTRAQGIMLVAVVIAGMAAVGIHLPERAGPALWPTTLVCGFTASYAGALLVWSRRRALIDERLVEGLGLACAAATLTAVYHVGVFSAAIMAAFVVIYFYSLGDSSFGAWTILLVTAVGYGTMAILAITGVLALGRALFPVVGAEPISMVVLTLVLEAMFCLTFMLGRWSRRATLHAMERLERAQRQLRQREALLDEAHAELDRALDADRVGRYTGEQAGPWQCEDLVGRGAMGDVYRARHVETSALAAVKILHPHLADEPTQAERFLREAKSAASVPSPHIVRLIESGHTREGGLYLAMELLDGEDLAHLLRNQRRFGGAAAIELVTQVAEGLAAAQEAGIVHRDLKPQNLFVVRGNGKTTWKILDFGVATVAESGSTLTQGAAVGTPSYMSPEQAKGREVDHRADVFALGVIAYRVLVGRPAFTGGDGLATMYNVVNVQPARPTDHVGVHEDVDRVLALALAKKRDRRFASSTAFAAALRDALRGRLDERFRRDADALIAEHPWGTDVTELTAEQRAEAGAQG